MGLRFIEANLHSDYFYPYIELFVALGVCVCVCIGDGWRGVHTCVCVEDRWCVCGRGC